MLCYFRRTAATLAARSAFTPVIGLEVHVQLASSSKLFSPAKVVDDAAPNSTVHLFDAATPGTLPMLNFECVRLALRMATALNCELPAFSRFDRKHYFYADMPAGYQITQAEYPIAKNGSMPVYVYGNDIEPYRRDVAIERLQLEQDSGKTVHHQDGVSLIDLNRAGAPLVEVVTKPVFRSALEATCFVQQLRLLLQHHRISHGHLHKGHIRVDANVSLSQNEQLGVRTEIKNLNSIRLLHTAINYEIDRQFGILSEGGRVLNETRGTDSQGRTVSMRDKEEETDYRMMPEPNLPLLKLRPAWISAAAAEVEHASQPQYLSRIREYDMSPRLAVEAIVGVACISQMRFQEEPKLSAFFDACCPHIQKVGEESRSKVPLSLFVEYLHDVRNICQREDVSFPPETPRFAAEFCAVLSLLHEGRITRLVALAELRGVLRHEIADVAQSERLYRIRAPADIALVLEQIATVRPELLHKAKSGSAKAFTKLRNALIDRSRKCITVDDAERLIRQSLGL